MELPELPENLENKQVEYELKQIKTIITTNLYQIQEPILTQQEQHLYGIIQKGMYEVINLDTETEEDIEQYLKECLDIILKELKIKPENQTMQKILYHTYKDFIGYGRIQPFLFDPLVQKITQIPETPIQIEHTVYNSLNTDITLTEGESHKIIRKLLLACNQSPETKTITCEHNDLSLNINNNNFTITKKFNKPSTPLTLIENNQASPEMLAFLWLIIENKIDIYTDNEQIQSALAYFLPAHSKILTNIKGFKPIAYQHTILDDKDSEQDYNFTNKELQGTKVLLTKELPDKDITCKTENNIIRTIQEQGRELFLFFNNKFYHNLENSQFLKSRGNISILKQELELRAKLLQTLKGISTQDLRKIIVIYYDNPTAVLKKARII